MESMQCKELKRGYIFTNGYFTDEAKSYIHKVNQKDSDLKMFLVDKDTLKFLENRKENPVKESVKEKANPKIKTPKEKTPVEEMKDYIDEIIF
jgi:predicted membrane-bound dolichyl-phosphate-mannose-protein mannosyltransferase